MPPDMSVVHAPPPPAFLICRVAVCSSPAPIAVDDIAAAAAKGDELGARAAWARGKDYLNGYVRLVNMPINAKVGDKFGTVTETL